MRTAIALLQSCEPETLERVRTILGRQVEALSRLIHDLYELARGERAQLALLLARISVDALVEHAVELALPLVQVRRHSLIVKVEPDQWIEADAGRLVQVLANLLTNAAKYTDAGGTIWLDAHCAVNHFVFCVRDNGIGIAADVLPHVFDAFVRSDRARRQEHDGAGLGLSVVRALVQQHGGTVQVRSDGPDRGSEFVVTLPHRRPSARTANRIVP